MAHLLRIQSSRIATTDRTVQFSLPDVPALRRDRNGCRGQMRREGWDRGRCQTGWDAESAQGLGSRRPPPEAQMRLSELTCRAPPHRGAAYASSIEWRAIAQHFFNSRREKLRSAAQPRELVRMVEKGENSV